MRPVRTTITVEFRFDSIEEVIDFLRKPDTSVELEHNVCIYRLELTSSGNLVMILKQNENGRLLDECECEEMDWDDEIFNVGECKGYLHQVKNS